MGYRHYIHKISKEELAEIKSLNTVSELCEWAKQHDYVFESVFEPPFDELTPENVPIYGLGTELYNFGTGVDWASKMQITNESLFNSKELKDFYEDYDPVILSKDDFRQVIDDCKNKIIAYYESLLTVTELDDRTVEQKQKAHVERQLNEWKNKFGLLPINTDLTTDKICDSCLFEYAIFELVRIYKTIDWENDAIILLGW